ncbi:MAG TPA: hypothetical protein VHY79_10460 [Rhizomicrobium sp.]|jgi:hypothetical protein|nr:hypothetical protein [Rhizomicrobium sp.]
MKTVLLTTAAALALCVAGAAQAAPGMHAAGARGTTHPVVHHAPPKGAKTLYDQNSSDGTYGFFSQTLSSYPQYDEYLADDFTVPKGHSWTVSEVDTTGFYYNGPGPATSVNVLFWNNKKGLPNGKKPAVECDNLTPTGGLDTGAYEITLPKTCKAQFKGGKKGTTYWVTVQANLQGFNTSGYWAWGTDPTVHGNQASGYWYGGSVETDNPTCNTSFQTIDFCFGSTVDLSFALLGKDKG